MIQLSECRPILLQSSSKSLAIKLIHMGYVFTANAQDLLRQVQYKSKGV